MIKFLPMKTKNKKEWQKAVDSATLESVIKDMQEWMGDDWRDKIQEWLKTPSGKKWKANFDSLKIKLDKA